MGYEQRGGRGRGRGQKRGGRSRGRGDQRQFHYPERGFQKGFHSVAEPEKTARLQLMQFLCSLGNTPAITVRQRYLLVIKRTLSRPETLSALRDILSASKRAFVSTMAAMDDPPAPT
jgi:hypothetical protein